MKGKSMPKPIPMDVAIHIIKHTNPHDKTFSYAARVTVGKPDLTLDEYSEEAYWCGAAGKDVAECLNAIREHTLLWAKREGITRIDGCLTESGPCELTLQIDEREIILVPVTYNDWLTETYL